MRRGRPLLDEAIPTMLCRRGKMRRILWRRLRGVPWGLQRGRTKRSPLTAVIQYYPSQLLPASRANSLQHCPHSTSMSPTSNRPPRPRNPRHHGRAPNTDTNAANTNDSGARLGRALQKRYILYPDKQLGRGKELVH